MTDAYDPSNEEHRKIKVISNPGRLLYAYINMFGSDTEHFWQAEIELGNGLPDVRTTRQCLEAVKEAGFEVSWLSVLTLYAVLYVLSSNSVLKGLNYMFNTSHIVSPK